MTSVGISMLTVLALVGALNAEDTTTTSTTTATVPITTDTSGGEKIARRIIEDRLMPPRASEFPTWNKRFPVSDVYRGNNGPPKVTEELDDNVTDKAVPLKRTVGSIPGETKAGSCCGISGKSSAPNGFTDEKEKSETLDLTSATGPAARFHGNKPDGDRFGHGWKSSSYLGYQFDKDKGYYDQRNRYPYDRYNSAPRPTSQGYSSQDGDRYTSSPQRPGSVYSSDGDRYGPSRPNNYQSSNYAYGGSPYGGSRPGLTGNIGEGDTDYPFPEGGPPSAPPSNLQTQKAVALKALAGVALIGAAAALASNPVLLPISVISGRRKRSAELQADNYALTALLQGYIQPTPNEVGQREKPERQSRNSTSQEELVISPHCVARLACHVHRDYLDELEKSKAVADEAALHGLEHWFDSLVHSNILVADYLSDELKSLIESAVSVGSNRNASCDQFSCLNVHDSSKKNTTTEGSKL